MDFQVTKFARNLAAIGANRSGHMALNKITHVLLDMDGTLLDTRKGINASARHALSALGHTPPPDADFRHLIGPPLESVLARALTEYADDRVAEAVIAYRAHYAEVGIHLFEVFPGIPQMLAQLKESGLVLILATSKREAFAKRLLATSDLEKHFHAIYGATPDGKMDHKQELIGEILSQQKCAPAAAIMVGDRREDIVGAHAHAVRAIGITWGYGERSELVEAGADLLADTPETLARLLSPG